MAPRMIYETESGLWINLDHVLAVEPKKLAKHNTVEWVLDFHVSTHIQGNSVYRSVKRFKTKDEAIKYLCEG